MNLEHANITVKSIDEAVRFLTIAFPEGTVRGGGFMHNDESRGRWVHFGTEGSYLALQENRQHSGRADTTYLNDGINHLGFVVEGLDDMVTRMAAQGYKLSPLSAMDAHPHRRRAYIFDNNGVEWEFVEYLSDKPAERNDYQQ